MPLALNHHRIESNQSKMVGAFYPRGRGAEGGSRRNDEVSAETMDSSLTSMLTENAPLMASMILANSDGSVDTEVDNISPVVSFAEEELEEPGRILPHSRRHGGTRGTANSHSSTHNQSRNHYSASAATTYEEDTAGEATDVDYHDGEGGGAPAGLLDYVLRPCPSPPKQLEDSLDHQFERVDQALEASGPWMDCMRNNSNGSNNNNNGEPWALPEPDAPDDELIMLEQQRHPVEKKSMLMETIDSPWLDHVPCSPTHSDGSDVYDEPLPRRDPRFTDRRKQNDKNEAGNDKGSNDGDDFGIKPTNSWLEYMGISSGGPSKEDILDEAENRRNANRDDGIDTLLQPSLSWIQMEDCKCTPGLKDPAIVAAPATTHNRAIGNEICQAMRSVGIPVPSLVDGSTTHEQTVKDASWTIEDDSDSDSSCNNNNNSIEESTLLTGPFEENYKQETGGEDTSTLDTIQTGPFPAKDMEEAGGKDTSTLDTLQTGPFEAKDIETPYGDNSSLLKHHQSSNRIGASSEDNAQQLDSTKNANTNTTETAIKSEVPESREQQLNANFDENESKDINNDQQEDEMADEQQWQQDKEQQQRSFGETSSRRVVVADTQSSANNQGQNTTTTTNSGNCFVNCGGLGGVLSALVPAEMSARKQPVSVDEDDETESYFNGTSLDDDTVSRSTSQSGIYDPPRLDRTTALASQKRVTFKIESMSSEESYLQCSSDGDIPQVEHVSSNHSRGEVQEDEESSPSDERPADEVGNQKQSSDNVSSTEEVNLHLSNIEVTNENDENKDRRVLIWPGDVRVKDGTVDYEGRDVECTDDEYQPTESSGNSMESSLTNDRAIALHKSVEGAIAPDTCEAKRTTGICRNCNRWTALIVSALVCMVAILIASAFAFKSNQREDKSSSQASPTFGDDQDGGPGKGNTESKDNTFTITNVPSGVPLNMPSSMPSSSPSGFPSASLSMGPTEFGVKIVDFAAIGDAPYTSEQAEEVKDQMEELDELAEFVIHVGDLHDDPNGNDCELADYEYAADLLLRAPVPVFVILGDNDRLDCPNRDEALKYWQDVFLWFENNWNHDFNVVRDPAMPHNFAFQHKSVLFVGLNIPGGELSEYEDHDWDELLDTNFEWARAVIEDYDERMGDRVGRIVIFSHGKPSDDHDPFYDALTELFEDDLSNKHPTLFINGDGHSWEYEREFRGRGSFLRIQVRGKAAEPPTMIKVVSTGEEQNPRDAFQYHRGDGDYTPSD